MITVWGLISTDIIKSGLLALWKSNTYNCGVIIMIQEMLAMSLN